MPRSCSAGVDWCCLLGSSSSPAPELYQRRADDAVGVLSPQEAHLVRPTEVANAELAAGDMEENEEEEEAKYLAKETGTLRPPRLSNEARSCFISISPRVSAFVRSLYSKKGQPEPEP